MICDTAGRHCAAEELSDRGGAHERWRITMSDAYVLQSAEGGLVIGFHRPPVPGSSVSSFEWKSGPFPAPWDYVPVPASDQQAGGWLVNAESGLCIGIESVVVDAPLELMERRQEDSQLWTFEAVTDEPGCYYIVGADQLVMDLRSPEPGAPILAAKRNRHRNQWWHQLTPQGDPA
jgi:hypothetical protein